MSDENTNQDTANEVFQDPLEKNYDTPTYDDPLDVACHNRQ